MLAYYRIDLREVLFTESPRYLLSLILDLPSNGAFYASRRGGREFRGWDVDRYLKVSQVNAQRANNHILVMVNRDPKKSAPKPPELFPTPDKHVEKPKPGSFAGIAGAMIAAQRKKKRELNGGK